MLFLIELLIITVVLGIWWYMQDKSRYSKYPPGPFRFPFVGNLPQVLKNKVDLPAVNFRKLADKHGDVMFLKLGQLETVVCTSLDAIHDMLTHDKATGRHQDEFIKDRHDNQNLGLIWGYGRPWQNLRRFTMRNLRVFGFGKSSTMDVVINEEIDKFHERLRVEVNNAPKNVIHVEDIFSVTVVNVLWRLMTGVSYDLKDPLILRWVQLNSDWYQSTSIGNDLSDFFPFLRNWFPTLMGRTAQKKMHNELFEFAKALLMKQMNADLASDYLPEPETFIEVVARKLEESKSDPDTDFTEKQFILTILDLIVAGSETSSNTLNFGILYMLLHPQVQEKVQSEIDREVPNHVPIDSTMKSRLPYTCATVLEMLRYSTVIPIPASREATEDFSYKGYTIKKGTSLLINLHALHYSEKLWGDPMNFRPERFLNSEGTAVNQAVADNLKNFGAGKRYCLGQSLAELSIFLYFASTLRKFKFVQVPGTNPTTEPVSGLTLMPQPYDVCVIERSRGIK